MIHGIKATDVVDALSDTISQLPADQQKAVWARLKEAADQYSEGTLDMEDFVLKLLPTNLFTPEERALLEAKGALLPTTVN